MKRAIAMKCNQEQWDAIKGKIPKERIVNLWSFDRCTCVTNIYDDIDGISNIAYSNGMYKGLVIDKTWNEQVFLEACGIETEKIFKGSELQFWDSHNKSWNNCRGENTKYRIKPDYSKEIAELERQIEILKNK